MKKVISIVLFVASVVMIGSGFYILNSNKYVFKTVLSKTLSYAVNNYYDNSFVLEDIIDSDKYKLTTNTGLSTLDNEMLSLVGDIYINNDRYYIDLDSHVLSKEFIGLEGLIDDSKFYLKIKEAMDKFYYIDITDNVNIQEEGNVDISGLSDLEKQDLKVLSKQLEKSILQDLSNNDFENNSETLTIYNKKFKTNCISLKLSAQDLRQIIIDLLENISNDSKSIQVLQKVDKNITKEDITTALNEFKEVSIDATDDEILDISLYISGISDVVRVEISTLNSVVDGMASDNITIIIDNYKDNSNHQVISLTIKENNDEIIKYTETKITNHKSDIEISIDEADQSILVKGSYKNTETAITASFDLHISNISIGNFYYNVNTITKDKEYEIEMDVSTTDELMTFSSVNNIYLNEEIPSIDINDSDEFKNMNNAEVEEINAYVYDKLEELGLEDYHQFFATWMFVLSGKVGVPNPANPLY